MVTTSAPRFEHLREARGIGDATPRLSWTNLAPAGWEQHAAEIEITRDGRVTTTGRVASVVRPRPCSHRRGLESGENPKETANKWQERVLISSRKGLINVVSSVRAHTPGKEQRAVLRIAGGTAGTSDAGQPLLSISGFGS